MRDTDRTNMLILPRTRFMDKPLALLIVTAAAIFVAEAIVMIILSSFPNIPIHHLPLVDATILLITVFPALYFLFFRPLRLHTRRLRAMSDENQRRGQALIRQHKMIAVGQLAAGVAHEIVNPLACMDSLLQLAQRRPERMAPEMVGELRGHVARINDIVRKLEDFSRPGPAKFDQCPLKEIMARALEIVDVERNFPNIHISLDMEDSMIGTIVNAQPYALEQVLMNIILNALDAMANEPQPRLSIRLRRNDQECFIDIIDNGHGIAPEHMDLLFNPFFTTKPPSKGTGLGLSVSYQLIHAHGGRIEAVSNAKGATFTVCLPLAFPADRAGIQA